MHGLARIAAVVAAVGLVAKAHAGPVRQLTRRLTPAEAAQPQKIADAFVSAIVDAGHRAGHDCRLATVAGAAGQARITRAQALPGGLKPVFPRLTLHCDLTPSAASLASVSLEIAVDAEQRAFLRPPKNVARQPGVHRRSSQGSESLYLERDAADAGTAMSAVRITVRADQPMGLLAGLAEPELAAELNAVGLLPPPPPLLPRPRPSSESSPEIISRSAVERSVVSAVLAEVAGPEARAILRKNPNRDAVPFDTPSRAAMVAATPDLDPALLADFTARQRTAALPALPPGVQVVDDEVLDAVFDQGSWGEFHRRYPEATGTLRLSPIAFGVDGAQAAVTVGWQRGPLDGIGALYVLQRDSAGAWTIIYEAILWLS